MRVRGCRGCFEEDEYGKIGALEVVREPCEGLLLGKEDIDWGRGLVKGYKYEKLRKVRRMGGQLKSDYGTTRFWERSRG